MTEELNLQRCLQAEKPTFKEHAPLVKWVTRRIMGKAAVRGLKVEYDDLHQEVYLIWAGCRDRYDPSLSKLSTFFTRSAMLAFDQGWLVRKINGRRPVGGMFSLNATTRGHVGSDNEAELIELIEDEGAEDPEAHMMRVEDVEQVLDDNPLLRRLVQISATPPPEITEQLAMLRAQREYARTLGVQASEMIPSSVTPEILRRIFRFNWRQRKLAQIEVQYGA